MLLHILNAGIMMNLSLARIENNWTKDLAFRKKIIKKMLIYIGIEQFYIEKKYILFNSVREIGIKEQVLNWSGVDHRPIAL